MTARDFKLSRSRKTAPVDSDAEQSLATLCEASTEKNDDPFNANERERSLKALEGTLACFNIFRGKPRTRTL